jgi:c(7)-type cytochrome triheme protein
MKAPFKIGKTALLFLPVALLGFAVFVSGTFNLAESATAKAAAAKPAGKTEAAKPPAQSVIDPTNASSVIYLDTAGKPAGIGDPNAPPSAAFKLGRGWHPQALSAVGLSKDRFGLIDWAKLVRDNVIKPKSSLDPADEEMPPLKLDVLIPAKGDFVDDVIYPHEMHTWWLKCEACHPNIFVPARGENNMTMVAIAQGQFCGRCHGKVAFPLADCKRCHTSPKSASKK